MKIHKSITQSRIEKAIKRQMTTLANPGYCLACGRPSNQCEPDARDYPCDSCGKNTVWGAEEIYMTFLM